MIVWKYSNSIATIAFLFLLQSCTYFETKKIPSETFLEEELKTINWNEVDTYPVFKMCENLSEKEKLKSCFVQTLTTTIYRFIASEKKPVNTTINDTIKVHFTVSKKAKLEINQLEIDSLTKAQLPKIERLIYQSIDSLQPIAPAYKRGVPVNTSFELPIVIVTN